MKLLERVLETNAQFVNAVGANAIISKMPAEEVAIFTCMDTRLVDFLEPAMGIKRGDAKIIKNAGPTIIDPQGGVIRSLVVAVYMLGVKEILVIGHKDCGMANLDAEELKRRMLAKGISAETIESFSADLGKWVGAFCDPGENVAEVVGLLRANPLLPDDVPIHGLLFCPDTGTLEVISQGY